MRIGIDARTLSYDYTGIPTYVHDVIRVWNEEGTENEYYLYSNREFKLDFKLGSNWHVVIDKHRFGTIWAIMRIPKLLKNDSIEAYWEPMNFLPPRIRGTKYYVTVHDLAVYLFPNLGTFTDALMEKLLLKKSCKRADKIIAISKATKNDIVHNLGIEDNKISVIYNGDSTYTVDNASYTESQGKEILEKWGLSKEKFLLYVGTIEPRKNVGTILAAYEYLRENETFDGKLVIAGKVGWKSGKTLKEISKSKYRHDIVLTGYITETEKECLYRNAACLAFPSLYEGFGFPLVEAMSVGIPVVTSRVSSLPEVGGDIPFYVDAEKVKDGTAVAEKFKEALLLDITEKETLRKNSYNRALQFDRCRTAKDLGKMIKGI